MDSKRRRVSLHLRKDTIIIIYRSEFFHVADICTWFVKRYFQFPLPVSQTTYQMQYLVPKAEQRRNNWVELFPERAALRKRSRDQMKLS